MNIFALLRNPLVRIIGAAIIIYFALFHDKKNPEALGNRLAPQRVKQELNIAKENSNFIISNVALAKQIAEEKQKKKQAGTLINTEVAIQDLEEGEGELKISCGDVVELNYGIYSEDDKQIEFKEKEKLIIGSRERMFIEKNIMDMKQGGVRNIKVPLNLKTDDKELNKLLQFYRSNLRYQITILSILHNSETQLTCN